MENAILDSLAKKIAKLTFHIGRYLILLGPKLMKNGKKLDNSVLLSAVQNSKHPFPE